MPVGNALPLGEHVMTVCNACRYCEEFCPVFPAMERRRVFTPGDLTQLANLCHNCGECLYACQYAPPHAFGINVPRTLAEIRLQSYVSASWPPFLGVAFRHHGVGTAMVLFAVLCLAVLLTALAGSEQPVWPTAGGADFYDVMPHHLMVGLFGGVSAIVLGIFVVGAARFWRTITPPSAPAIRLAALRRALGEALSLAHLHGGGTNCAEAEETRSPWRRYFHHATMYGFLLCFGSTSVAAVYHFLGWPAPYGYASVPVILGATGGLGLLAGPAGLWVLGRRRDPALTDPDQRGLDDSFIVLLFATSVTGLLLLVLRETSWMGVLLVVHLGAVLTIFVSLPYGKAVHGVYRLLALVRDRSEDEADRRDGL